MAGAIQVSAGVTHWPGALDRSAQEALREVVREVVRQAPLFQPTMPRTGQPLSVRMSNCGSLGWVADERGYRYQSTHPDTGATWPAMPRALLDLWVQFAGYPHPPEACLINFYDAAARMGLHQDRDEDTFDAPVLSISLGDRALFRIGGLTRRDSSHAIVLDSGDVLRLAGPARLAFHGIDRIIPGSSTLLPQGGRLNLTLRRVRRPD